MNEANAGAESVDWNRARGIVRALTDNIEKVIVGKGEAIRLALTALISGGHALVEDVPGTGKTTLARALAQSIEADFRRLQFTPDLLPSDVTGVSVFNPKSADFEFRPGPVFTDILLVDEINRGTPRAQSSLLECMEERQVTVDGETHRLSPSFFVIATQNPIEQHGTFPLPEAQLDRFALTLSFGYPSDEELLRIVDAQTLRHPLAGLSSVATGAELELLRVAARRVGVEETVKRYLIKVAVATRDHPAVALGASTRAVIRLAAVTRAFALVQGRNFVTPDDVKQAASPVLAHRLLLDTKARLNRITAKDVVQEILSATPVPIQPDPLIHPPGP